MAKKRFTKNIKKYAAGGFGAEQLIQGVSGIMPVFADLSDDGKAHGSTIGQAVGSAAGFGLNFIPGVGPIVSQALTPMLSAAGNYIGGLFDKEKKPRIKPYGYNVNSVGNQGSYSFRAGGMVPGMMPAQTEVDETVYNPQTNNLGDTNADLPHNQMGGQATDMLKPGDYVFPSHASAPEKKRTAKQWEEVFKKIGAEDILGKLSLTKGKRYSTADISELIDQKYSPKEISDDFFSENTNNLMEQNKQQAMQVLMMLNEMDKANTSNNSGNIVSMALGGFVPQYAGGGIVRGGGDEEKEREIRAKVAKGEILTKEEVKFIEKLQEIGRGTLSFTGDREKLLNINEYRIKLRDNTWTRDDIYRFEGFSSEIPEQERGQMRKALIQFKTNNKLPLSAQDNEYIKTSGFVPDTSKVKDLNSDEAAKLESSKYFSNLTGEQRNKKFNELKRRYDKGKSEDFTPEETNFLYAETVVKNIESKERLREKNKRGEKFDKKDLEEFAYLEAIPNSGGFSGMERHEIMQNQALPKPKTSNETPAVTESKTAQQISTIDPSIVEQYRVAIDEVFTTPDKYTAEVNTVLDKLRRGIEPTQKEMDKAVSSQTEYGAKKLNEVAKAVKRRAQIPGITPEYINSYTKKVGAKESYKKLKDKVDSGQSLTDSEKTELYSLRDGITKDEFDYVIDKSANIRLGTDKASIEQGPPANDTKPAQAAVSTAEVIPQALKTPTYQDIKEKADRNEVLTEEELRIVDDLYRTGKITFDNYNTIRDKARESRRIAYENANTPVDAPNFQTNDQSGMLNDKLKKAQDKVNAGGTITFDEWNALRQDLDRKKLSTRPAMDVYEQSEKNHLANIKRKIGTGETLTPEEEESIKYDQRYKNLLNPQELAQAKTNWGIVPYGAIIPTNDAPQAPAAVTAPVQNSAADPVVPKVAEKTPEPVLQPPTQQGAFNVPSLWSGIPMNPNSIPQGQGVPVMSQGYKQGKILTVIPQENTVPLNPPDLSRFGQPEINNEPTFYDSPAYQEGRYNKNAEVKPFQYFSQDTEDKTYPWQNQTNMKSSSMEDKQGGFNWGDPSMWAQFAGDTMALFANMRQKAPKLKGYSDAPYRALYQQMVPNYGLYDNLTNSTLNQQQNALRGSVSNQSLLTAGQNQQVAQGLKGMNSAALNEQQRMDQIRQTQLSGIDQIARANVQVGNENMANKIALENAKKSAMAQYGQSVAGNMARRRSQDMENQLYAGLYGNAYPYAGELDMTQFLPRFGRPKK